MSAVHINKVCGTEWRLPTINIRTAARNGMTVRELIHRLSSFNPDHKVVYYDENGQTYNVIQAVQDSKNVIAIF